MADKRNNMRIPPQSLDSEKAVLGSIMLRPGAIHEIMDMITGQSFYAAKHMHIFAVMQELSAKNEPIDLLSVSQKLEEKNFLILLVAQHTLLNLQILFLLRQISVIMLMW